MPRTTLLPILCTVICFGAALVFLGTAAAVIETDGLSVVSHGLHIIPQHPAEVTEKMEEIMEENYRHSPFQEPHRDEKDVFSTRLSGTVLTMQYAAPVNLTWSFFQNGEEYIWTLVNSASALAVPCPGGNWIAADRIDILIPDNAILEIKDVSYFALIYATERPEPYRIAVGREQVNELLALIGMNPLPESLLP